MANRIKEEQIYVLFYFQYILKRLSLLRNSNGCILLSPYSGWRILFQLQLLHSKNNFNLDGQSPTN